MSFEKAGNDVLEGEKVLSTIKTIVQRQKYAEHIRIVDKYGNYFLYYPETRIMLLWIVNGDEGLGYNNERLRDTEVGYDTVSIHVNQLRWKDIDILSEWKRIAIRVQVIAVEKPTDVDTENLIEEKLKNRFAYFHYQCLADDKQITSP